MKPCIAIDHYLAWSPSYKLLPGEQWNKYTGKEVDSIQ